MSFASIWILGWSLVMASQPFCPSLVQSINYRPADRINRVLDRVFGPIYAINLSAELEHKYREVVIPHLTSNNPQNPNLGELIASDWFDEHGLEEFAEYLRISLQLEQLSFSDPRLHKLQKMFRKLHHKFRHSIFAPWFKLLPDAFPGFALQSRHGFIRAVWCSSPNCFSKKHLLSELKNLTVLEVLTNVVPTINSLIFDEWFFVQSNSHTFETFPGSVRHLKVVAWINSLPPSITMVQQILGTQQNLNSLHFHLKTDVGQFHLPLHVDRPALAGIGPSSQPVDFDSDEMEQLINNLPNGFLLRALRETILQICDRYPNLTVRLSVEPTH